MNDLIKKLKDKSYVRAFGLMSEEEQEVYRKVGAINCLFYNYHGKWERLGQDRADFLNCNNTYAIKPDYQPEPEYYDFLIEKDKEGWLGIFRDAEDYVSILPFHFTHLHCLPSLPNFAGFHREGMAVSLDLEYVAKYISEGKKVLARMRKE